MAKRKKPNGPEIPPETVAGKKRAISGKKRIARLKVAALNNVKTILAKLVEKERLAREDIVKQVTRALGVTAWPSYVDKKAKYVSVMRAQLRECHAEREYNSAVLALSRRYGQLISVDPEHVEIASERQIKLIEI